MFSKAVADYTREKIPEHIAKLNTEYVTKFLSGIFVAIFIVMKTPAVLNHELSLGIFLATISIFTTDLANTVTELNQEVRHIGDSFVPLQEFKFYLNLPLHLAEAKEMQT